MEDEKAGDIRVPLISSFFCLCVLTGGIFLVLYVFYPTLSRPWFPIPALLLIGSPWLFWLCTYFYTCVKACCVTRGLTGPAPSRQNTRAATSAPTTDGYNGHQQVSSVASSKESESPLTASV